jgi:hypothetical protein
MSPVDRSFSKLMMYRENPAKIQFGKKSAKVYRCLYSSLEQLQIALWTYMFLKLGLNNKKYIHNRPPKFNKNYQTRAARVKGFPEIKCFPSGSNLSRPRAFFLSTGPQGLWYAYEVPCHPPIAASRILPAIFWCQNYVPVRQYGLTFFVLSFFIQFFDHFFFLFFSSF